MDTPTLSHSQKYVLGVGSGEYRYIPGTSSFLIQQNLVLWPNGLTEETCSENNNGREQNLECRTESFFTRELDLERKERSLCSYIRFEKHSAVWSN